MGLPSGTYTRSTSGPLQITFSGQFSASSDLWSPGENALVLTCTVTDGVTTRTVPLTGAAPTAFVDWDYVAGTTLTCSMVVSFWSTTTTGSVAASRLRIRAVLMKR